MNRKVIAVLGIVIIVAVGVVAVTLYLMRLNESDPNGNVPPTFDPGNRYDSTDLDYMNVIYESQSDIHAFNGGYSESINCPWGAIHKGIDYFFNNGSTVIAAAPGQVEEISVTDHGEGVDNRFHLSMNIRFNQTVWIQYNFEPWTQDPLDKDRQLAMFNVQEGDWVAIGEEIATFLQIAGSAHIHFGVYDDDVGVEDPVGGSGVCPRPYFSAEGYAEIMSLIHSYHPDWELCYP
ncbi:MAG: M23 family metallopeptidase [Promethearchaeota archaeon]